MSILGGGLKGLTWAGTSRVSKDTVELYAAQNYCEVASRSVQFDYCSIYGMQAFHTV
jgi:hypothetical protein